MSLLQWAATLSVGFVSGLYFARWWLVRVEREDLRRLEDGMREDAERYNAAMDGEREDRERPVRDG